MKISPRVFFEAWGFEAMLIFVTQNWSKYVLVILERSLNWSRYKLYILFDN